MWLYIYLCVHAQVENLGGDPQEPDGFGCLWDEGWGLLFTVYVLYVLNFVPCTCVIYSKNKVFKFLKRNTMSDFWSVNPLSLGI